MRTHLLLPTVVLLLLAGTLAHYTESVVAETVGLSDGQPNITDFEIRGYTALFELANLTTHVPESFIIRRRTAQDVADQIGVFERQGTQSLLAGGFVSSFLDLITNIQDVA